MTWKRIGWKSAHLLYRIANRLDPGIEHEFYVCPECHARWRREP